MSEGPRSRAERRRDTEHRLTHDVDVWVASASADGAPYLVPLSFDWDGAALLMATPTDSPTGLLSRLGKPHVGPPRAFCFDVPSVRAVEQVSIKTGAGKTQKRSCRRCTSK